MQSDFILLKSIQYMFYPGIQIQEGVDVYVCVLVRRVIPWIWATCVNWLIRFKFHGTFRDIMGHSIN